jgi:hypothetical protein
MKRKFGHASYAQERRVCSLPWLTCCPARGRQGGRSRKRGAMAGLLHVLTRSRAGPGRHATAAASRAKRQSLLSTLPRTHQRHRTVDDIKSTVHILVTHRPDPGRTFELPSPFRCLQIDVGNNVWQGGIGLLIQMVSSVPRFHTASSMSHNRSSEMHEARTRSTCLVSLSLFFLLRAFINK